MERPPIFRFFRIRWIELGVLACGMLILRWVRSHRSKDLWRFELGTMRVFEAESAVGQFGIFTYPFNDVATHERSALRWFVIPVTVDPCLPADNRHGFKAYFRAGYAGVVVSHWLLALFASTLTVAVVVRRLDRFRFSLRTLFILTTFIAVLLGIIAAAIR